MTQKYIQPDARSKLTNQDGTPTPETVRYLAGIAAISEFSQYFFVGDGSPENVVEASPPAIYFNRSGGAGTTLYVKESGTATDTGWIGK